MRVKITYQQRKKAAILAINVKYFSYSVILVVLWQKKRFLFFLEQKYEIDDFATIFLRGSKNLRELDCDHFKKNNNSCEHFGKF